MIQVSLAGYASSGAFLGLAYFDFLYVIVVVVVVLYNTVQGLLVSAGNQPGRRQPMVDPGAQHHGFAGNPTVPT